MSEPKIEVVEVRGEAITITLTTGYAKSKFPEWLKSRSEWYSVLKEDKYIGEIYCIDSYWRSFDTCVTDIGGKKTACLEWLIKNS